MKDAEANNVEKLASGAPAKSSPDPELITRVLVNEVSPSKHFIKIFLVGQFVTKNMSEVLFRKNNVSLETILLLKYSIFLIESHQNLNNTNYITKVEKLLYVFLA